MKKTELCKKIEKLRLDGNSYKKIVSILGCSLGTVCYYLNPNQKEKTYERKKKYTKLSHPYLRKLQRFKNAKSKNKKDNNLINNRAFYYKYYNFVTRGKKMSDYTIEDVILKIGKNPKCYLTGIPIDINNTKSYEFDHIIPTSRGGSNDLENLGICLSSINKAKHNLTKEEFIELCNLVVKYNT